MRKEVHMATRANLKRITAVVFCLLLVPAFAGRQQYYEPLGLPPGAMPLRILLIGSASARREPPGRVSPVPCRAVFHELGANLDQSGASPEQSASDRVPLASLGDRME